MDGRVTKEPYFPMCDIAGQCGSVRSGSIDTKPTCLCSHRMSAVGGILLQKSKLASAKFFREILKRQRVDDSYNLSRVTEVAYEFGVRQ